MEELIAFENQNSVISSLKIAEFLGVKHERVTRRIIQYKEEIEESGHLVAIEITPPGKRRPVIYYNFTISQAFSFALWVELGEIRTPKLFDLKFIFNREYSRMKKATGMRDSIDDWFDEMASKSN